MVFLRLLIIVTPIFGVYTNKMSGEDSFFLVLASLLFLCITSNYNIKQHFAKYIVLFTYWISMILMPSFHIVINQTGDFEINQLSYDRIISFGSRIFLLGTIVFVLLTPLYSKKLKHDFVYLPRPISNSVVNASLYIMFGLSLFSYSIGLSRMGADQVELPFHLSGIITLIRTTFYPIFFAILVENFILTKRKFPKRFFLMFFAWSLLEVFVRLSKSAMAYSFLVVAILLCIYYRPNPTTIARTVVPFVVFFLFLYPIVETMRSMSGGGLAESFIESHKMVDSEVGDRLLAPLNRTFMMPQMYAKDYSYINTNSFFDFSKTPIVVASGGAARYQTFVIDGYPPEVNHSSGTTGLQDPLLHGGYGLCYIVVFLIFLMAAFVDSLAQKKRYSIYTVLVLMLWGFCNNQNISSFYDSVGVQGLLLQLVAIYVAYYINFTRKRTLSGV